MIAKYGYSLKGKSHLARGICCQDSHKILELDDGTYIIAIADGLGSKKNAEAGSKIAVESSTNFLKESLPEDFDNKMVKNLLKLAFEKALEDIFNESNKSKEPVDSYDTTLTVAVFKNGYVTYGHSGDGAVIVLTRSGEYNKITQEQVGMEYGSVYPLRAGADIWVFDEYEKEVSAVILVTDGMLEALCPHILKGSVYVPLAEYFADPYGFKNLKEEENNIYGSIENFVQANDDYIINDFYNRLACIYKNHMPNEYKEAIADIRKNHYPLHFIHEILDDKTIAVIVDTVNIADSKEKEYYFDEDWYSINEKWNKTMYPNLY